MKRKGAVIFDMDGVLVDTEPVYNEICKGLFVTLGVDMPMDRLQSYVGIPTRRMWTEIRDHYDLTHPVEDLIRMDEAERSRRLLDMKTIPVVDGVYALVEKLHRSGVAMGVASSSPREIIDIILTRTDLVQCFGAIISSEDVSRGKPAPDIFLMASAGLRQAPADCIVIEDSPHGVKGAKAAGMKAVGFANTHSGNQDLSRADLVIDDFSSSSVNQILELIGVKSALGFFR